MQNGKAVKTPEWNGTIILAGAAEARLAKKSLNQIVIVPTSRCGEYGKCPERGTQSKLGAVKSLR